MQCNRPAGFAAAHKVMGKENFRVVCKQNPDGGYFCKAATASATGFNLAYCRLFMAKPLPG